MTRPMKHIAWETWNRVMIVIGTVATVLSLAIAVWALVSPADLTSRVTALLERVATGTEKSKMETSENPRKELANMGNPFTRDGMRDALARGDEEAVALYLQAGFDWTTLGDEQSLLAMLSRLPNEKTIQMLASESDRFGGLMCGWLARQAQTIRAGGTCAFDGDFWGILVTRAGAVRTEALCGSEFRASVKACIEHPDETWGASANKQLIPMLAELD